jgi:hypothetical protein
MRLGFLSLILSFLFFGRSPAFAGKATQCALSWDKTNSPGKVEKSFTLETQQGKVQVSPEAGTTVVVSQKGSSSGVTIEQAYGDAPGNFVRYEIGCDSALNCKGERKNVAAGKVVSEDRLRFTPTTIGIGKIGERTVFVFEPKGSGFSYQFIQYELPGKGAVGMRLSCGM